MSTSRHFCRLLLAGLCAASASAQSATATPEIDIRFTGVVQADDNKAESIASGLRHATIAWICHNGERVAAGDRLVIFDTSPIVRMLPERRADVEIAKADIELQTRRLDAQLAAMIEDRKMAEAELKICQASLGKLRAAEADRVALAKANYDLAMQRSERQKREFERASDLHILGVVSDADLGKSREAAELARLDTIPPYTEWQESLASRDTDQADSLRLQSEQLGIRIGGETADGGTGLVGQIISLTKRRERQRATDLIEYERVGKSLHSSIRDAYDHTPVTFVEIATTDGAVIKKIDFVPVGGAAKAASDHGAPFDEERGYGWSHDVSDCIQPAVDGGLSCVVIEQQRSWTCVIGDGSYNLSVGFGDAQDWNGAIARWKSGTQGGLVHVARRIEARKYRTATVPVTVSGGRLELVFGDTCAKALRSERDGTALRQEWIKPGVRIQWNAQQLISLVDSRSLTVHGRVHQDLATFLRVAGTGTPAKKPQDRLKAEAGVIITRAGKRIRGTISAVIEQPIPISRSQQAGSELDCIAHEVVLTIAPEDALTLSLGETVDCVCPVALAEGMVSLPAHLVADTNNACYVRARGQDSLTEVAAVRLGNHFVVLDGLKPGADLVPPGAASAESFARVLIPGEVVGGRRTPVSIQGRIWGRIKTLIPEGSYVSKGQVVITLYSPQLDMRRDTLEQEKKLATQRLLLSAESNQMKTIQDAAGNKATLIDEKIKRAAIAQALEADPVRLSEDEIEARKATVAAESRRTLRDAGEAMRQQDPARYAALSSDAERAAIAAHSRLLRFILASRSANWLSFRTAVETWNAAVDKLDTYENGFHVDQFEAEVASRLTKITLDQAMEGNSREKTFNKYKELKAPVDGRLFYQKSWDEATNSMQKVKKDALVYMGLTIAEVLDVSQLSFRVEVPESRFRQLRNGQTVTVVFTQFNNRMVSGRVSSTGRSVHAVVDAGVDRIIANNRAFQVVVDMEVPDDLRDMLVPGTKGQLALDAPVSEVTP
jgi:hypothetical protein